MLLAENHDRYMAMQLNPGLWVMQKIVSFFFVKEKNE
jgi:hypothetical protein